MSSRVFAPQGLEAALREIVEIGVQLLDVNRLSIWLHEDNDKASRCTIAYTRKLKSFESAIVAELATMAAYSKTLIEQHIVTINDTDTYRNPDSVRSSLQKPWNIRAVMEGDVLQDDRLIGSLVASWFKQPHKWTANEIAYQGILCQFIANLFERSSRQAAETRPRDWINTSSVSR